MTTVVPGLAEVVLLSCGEWKREGEWKRHLAIGHRTLCGVDFGASLVDVGAELPEREAALADLAERCVADGCKQAWGDLTLDARDRLR